MLIYNVFATGYSGSEQWTHRLIGAFSTFESACTYLEQNEYHPTGESRTHWEWGWGSEAEIVETPLDEVDGSPLAGEGGVWSATESN